MNLPDDDFAEEFDVLSAWNKLSEDERRRMEEEQTRDIKEMEAGEQLIARDMRFTINGWEADYLNALIGIDAKLREIFLAGVETGIMEKQDEKVD